MIIIDKTMHVPFSKLGDGDVCIHGNAYCMKIQELTTMSARYTAVMLSTGVLFNIAKDQRVQPVNARFIVERT